MQLSYDLCFLAFKFNYSCSIVCAKMYIFNKDIALPFNIEEC